VPSPTPYGLLFPKIGGSQPHPKTAITVISGTAKATDCKFEHKPMKNFGEKGAWAYRSSLQGRPKFFKYPLLSQEWAKLQTSNLAGIFTGSMRTKALLKCGRKWSVGISRDCPNLLSNPYYVRNG